MAQLLTGGLDALAGDIDEVFAGNQIIHQAVFKRLFGRQRFAGENDAERLWQADEAGPAPGNPPGPQQAPVGLRPTHPRPFVRRGGPAMAEPAQLPSAPAASAPQRTA